MGMQPVHHALGSIDQWCSLFCASSLPAYHGFSSRWPSIGQTISYSSQSIARRVLSFWYLDSYIGDVRSFGLQFPFGCVVPSVSIFFFFKFEVPVGISVFQGFASYIIFLPKKKGPHISSFLLSKKTPIPSFIISFSLILITDLRLFPLSFSFTIFLIFINILLINNNIQPTFLEQLFFFFFFSNSSKTSCFHQQ